MEEAADVQVQLSRIPLLGAFAALLACAALAPASALAFDHPFIGQIQHRHPDRAAPGPRTET